MKTDQLETEINNTELELNKALLKAGELLRKANSLRQSNLDPNSRRRGWGDEPEHDRMLKLLEAFTCHVTEYGGGTTSDQQIALDAALECF